MTSTSVPPIQGTLITGVGGKGSIRMEAVYDTDPSDLWTAITDPVRLARWIAVVDGDLRPGGAITARFTSEWEGPGRVEVCDPPARLLVTLSPGAEDETTLEAVLTPEEGRCRLTVEERGLPMGDRPYHAAGWQVHLQDLAAEVGGRPVEPWKPRWQALLPSYLG